jgi:hypothetical protein
MYTAKTLRHPRLLAQASICRQCLRSRAAPFSASAPVHKYLKTPKPKGAPRLEHRQQDFQREWAERLERIEKGEEQNVWDIFEERGFIKDVAGYERNHIPQGICETPNLIA